MAYPFYSQAQDVIENTYLPNNLNSLQYYISQVTNEQAKRAEGKYASKIRKIYVDREKQMKKAITDSVYFFHEDLNKNLAVILNHIYESNPAIDYNDFYFFIKNSIVPNAACYGDGTFEINLGLFTTYDTDDELAYVICHEIAHKILDHSFKKMNEVVARLHSKQTKEEIRKVEKIKYGRTRAGLALLDEINSDFLKHSKETEAEADSLGFVLFRNTKYEQKSAISALKKLEVADQGFLDNEIQLERIFNFETYPFKSYWLEDEITLFDTKERIDDFSLSSEKEKTHPEIQYRIDKIEQEFELENFGEVSNTYINPINDIASIQNITYTIDFNLLDLAFYQLVSKYEHGQISGAYYQQTMAEVLKRVYLAKKNHELGKYVPRKNNFSNEEELNKIRLFLHNLELGEVRRIFLAFCETNLLKQPDNKPLKSTYEFFKR